MNPFIAFCLYVAARVFVQYLKSRPEDQTVGASLEFMLCAMRALKHTNPLTESFLIQLDVDLEGSGMDDPNNSSRFSFTMKKGVVCIKSWRCAASRPSCSLPPHEKLTMSPLQGRNTCKHWQRVMLNYLRNRAVSIFRRHNPSLERLNRWPSSPSDHKRLAYGFQ